MKLDCHSMRVVFYKFARQRRMGNVCVRIIHFVDWRYLIWMWIHIIYITAFTGIRSVHICFNLIVYFHYPTFFLCFAFITKIFEKELVLILSSDIQTSKFSNLFWWSFLSADILWKCLVRKTLYLRIKSCSIRYQNQSGFVINLKNCYFWEFIQCAYWFLG